jgi:hypothetical protein
MPGAVDGSMQRASAIEATALRTIRLSIPGVSVLHG